MRTNQRNDYRYILLSVCLELCILFYAIYGPVRFNLSIYLVMIATMYVLILLSSSKQMYEQLALFRVSS